MATSLRALRSLSAVLLAASVTPSVSAAPPELKASASCERRATKGRVVCDVEAEAEAEGSRIAWADVLVLVAPSFAPPLRNRVGMADARARTETRVRVPVAFVASGAGQGRVTFRARAVVCRKTGEGPEACVTRSREVSADLVVGTAVDR